jgi:hypothetical protein
MYIQERLNLFIKLSNHQIIKSSNNYGLLRAEISHHLFMDDESGKPGPYYNPSSKPEPKPTHKDKEIVFSSEYDDSTTTSYRRNGNTGLCNTQIKPNSRCSPHNRHNH